MDGHRFYTNYGTDSSQIFEALHNAQRRHTGTMFYQQCTVPVSNKLFQMCKLTRGDSCR
jgi:hypothetical protein